MIAQLVTTSNAHQLIAHYAKLTQASRFKVPRNGPKNPVKGLLKWLLGFTLDFPLQSATPRFDAIRAALEQGDIQGFENAARKVIGLGPGLTPSGDDFVAGCMYVLAHHAPAHWQADMPSLKSHLHAAAMQLTTACSAAHLDNAMRGDSFDALRHMLDALTADTFNEPHWQRILQAQQDLQNIGASSGADMLAGMLTALIALEKNRVFSEK